MINAERQQIFDAIHDEIERSNDKYPSTFSSPKQALWVLREEYLEVEEELLKTKLSGVRENPALAIELIQLAAMAVKAIHSLIKI